MIKRLLRVWLRLKICKEIGACVLNHDKLFDWIYNAPISQWPVRLYCIRRFQYYAQIEPTEERINELLEKAKELSNVIYK